MKQLHKEFKSIDFGSIPTSVVTTALDLDVTDGCNLACPYCFKNLDKPANMSFETAKSSINWLIYASADSPAIFVNFMGGEPTLRFKLLKDIVRWGKLRAKTVGKSISFSMTSNMTIWTSEIREWVDQEGIGVLMSIDGRPETQDTQRPSKSGVSYSSKIADWSKSMLRTRPFSDARMTVPPASAESFFDNCIYIWEELGFKNLVFAEADFESWNDDIINSYEFQVEKVCDYLFNDYLKSGDKSLKTISYFMKNLVHKRKNNELIARRNSPCGAGYNYMMIDHKGDIWPCHRFDGASEEVDMSNKFRMGNIYKNEFNNELSNAFQFFDHSQVYKPACKTCPIEPVCGGFCPASNLSETGNIYTPHDNYCKIKWMLYRQSEKLYEKMFAHDSNKIVQHLERLGASLDV